MSDEGQEFLLTEADDFEKEAKALRNSAAFQRFLAARSRSPRRFSLEEIETEIERDRALKEIQ